MHGDVMEIKPVPGGKSVFLADSSAAAGNVWFIDSNNGTDAPGNGKSRGTGALASLAYLLAGSTSPAFADYDVVHLMPGHAETLAADLTIAKNSVAIIGHGRGSAMPKLTFDTNTDEIVVTGSGVMLKDFWCYATVASLQTFIDVDEGDFEADGLWTTTAAGTAGALCHFDLATTKDNFVIRNHYALSDTDPNGTDQGDSTGFVYCVDSENILLENVTALGNFETAIVHNKTTKAQNLFIRDCRFRQELATGLLIEVVAATTGGAERLYGHSPNADDATPAKMIGTYDVEFWIAGDCWFSNDSGGGGQLMINSEAACS